MKEEAQAVLEHCKLGEHLKLLGHAYRTLAW